MTFLEINKSHNLKVNKQEYRAHLLPRYNYKIDGKIETIVFMRGQRHSMRINEN